MIPFDFEYLRPDSTDEAVANFRDLRNAGKEPAYYSGGTEIITMARLSQMYTGAVIDIKAIPECNVFEFQGDKLVIGAGVTLTRITEANLFPLLGKSAGRVADHTTRCKITLGGNIAGKIIYREAVLPLMVADAEMVIVGESGQRRIPISEAFDRTLRLASGDLLVQVVVDGIYTGLPNVGMKQTRIDKIDYPILTIAALKKDGKVRVALSGLCEFPFRSYEMEDALNDRAIPPETRIDNAMCHIPAAIMGDISGSPKYRKLVLESTLVHTLTELGVGEP